MIEHLVASEARHVQRPRQTSPTCRLRSRVGRYERVAKIPSHRFAAAKTIFMRSGDPVKLRIKVSSHWFVKRLNNIYIVPHDLSAIVFQVCSSAMTGHG